MGAAEGPWITAAQRTFDQAYQQWNMICGGGIYWVRYGKRAEEGRELMAKIAVSRSEQWCVPVVLYAGFHC